MASVLYDTKYPKSDEARRLRRMLGNDCADALPPRLWAWGIEAENVKGVFEADAKQLAGIVEFYGDPEALLKAFLVCEVIEPTGNDHEYRIKGWKRNARLFKERERLRKISRTRAKRVKHARETRASGVENGSSSSSSSSSSLGSKNNTGDPAVVIEKAGDAANDSPVKREFRPTRGFAEAAFEAAFVEGGKAAGITVAKFDGLETSIGGKLLLRAGKEGITQSQLLAEWWQPCWRHWHGFTVKDLDKHFAKLRAAIDDPKLRPKAPETKAADQKPPGWRAIPTPDETAAKRAAEKAKAEAIANDPEEQAGIERVKEDLRRKGVLT